MKRKKLCTRFITILVVAFLSFGPLNSNEIAKASGIPTVDVLQNLFLKLGLSQETISAVQETLSTGQQFYEWKQSFALSNLKGKLVGMLQDKILEYVNGGGNAKYVGDWVGYFSKTKDDARSLVAGNLAASDFCPHFKNQLLKSVGAAGATGGEKIEGVDCDFTKEEIENFNSNPLSMTRSDFDKFLKPNNNLIESALRANALQERVISEAEKAAEAEAISGGGFLSARDSSGNITTPGSVLKDVTSKAAEADFDLIVNAEQLKDIVGLIGKSLVSQLTSEGEDRGLANVDTASRRRNRNNGGGSPSFAQIPDCGQVLLETMTSDQRSRFDLDGNETLDENEVSEALSSGEGIETDIYTACTENAAALTNSKALGANSEISQLLNLRKEAKKNFDEQIGKFATTPQTLRGYINKTKDKFAYKIDNPFYDPSVGGSECKKAQSNSAADMQTAMKACQFLYFNRAVNWRQCFDASKLDSSKIRVGKHNFGASTRWIAYYTDAVPYIDLAGLKSLFNTTDDAIAARFVPGTVPTTNIGAGGQTTRCTVNVKDSTNELIEIAYYDQILNIAKKVDSANKVAITKLTLMQDVFEKAANSRPVKDRGPKLRNILNDFECHAARFVCSVPDPTNVNRTINPAPQTENQPAEDPRPTLNEAGYYFNGDLNDWRPLPAHNIIPADALNSDSSQSPRIDTYDSILEKLTNLEAIAQTMQDGLISNINIERADDDPGNPFYEPAFDMKETQQVLEFSNGNFAVIGDLDPPDDNDSADSTVDSGADASSDNDSSSIAQ